MSWRDYGLTSVEVDEYITQIVGIGALIFSLIYRIPQIYTIYRTKKAGDISTYMLIIQNLSYILYILYGIFIHDWINISTSVISFIQNLIIYFMKRRYALNDTLCLFQDGHLRHQNSINERLCLSNPINERH